MASFENIIVLPLHNSTAQLTGFVKKIYFKVFCSTFHELNIIGELII